MSVDADTVTRGPTLPRRAGLWVGVGGVALLLLLALFPGTVVRLSPAPGDPQACSLRGADGRFQDRLPPSASHWFGTDIQGCDYFTRVVHGARVSLAVAVGAVAIAVVIGALVGGTAGFVGGRCDRVLTRTTDLFVGLPQVLMAILLLTTLTGASRSVLEVTVVLGILGWPFTARILRARVLAVRDRPYVDAAKVAGAPTGRVLLQHVVPNAAGTLLAYAAVAIGLVVGIEAALAFLGVGLSSPTISWGLMIGPAQARLAESPHLMLFPCIFIGLTAMSFLLLGNAIGDALDPREQR